MSVAAQMGRIYAIIIMMVTHAAAHNIYPVLSTRDITLVQHQNTVFTLGINGPVNEAFNITFIDSYPNLIEIQPAAIDVKPTNSQLTNYLISVKGINPGLLDVTTATQPNNTIHFSNLFFHVTIAVSPIITYASIFVGWLYFLAWSASFYPQIYDNFRRKSVVGLNFDYLSFNLVGFIMYGAFNAGLFWCQTIQQEYFSRYPTGLNPVLLNDVFFSLNALLATLLTVFQCFVYERAEQRVSTIARCILSFFFVTIVVLSALGANSQILWLDFLYYCSYIKLSITLIKYIPQAVMNYRRKSTVGWSIGCIFLDIIGGVFSILQMLLNAYNYNDWGSIFGDPTKFGLGLFSICFDVFFIFQHYVLYRAPKTGLRENDSNLDRLLTEKAEP